GATSCSSRARRARGWSGSRKPSSTPTSTRPTCSRARRRPGRRSSDGPAAALSLRQREELELREVAVEAGLAGEVGEAFSDPPRLGERVGVAAAAFLHRGRGNVVTGRGEGGI